MNAYEKIRAALKNRATSEETMAALAALADLDRADAEPVATVLGIVVEWTGEQPTAGTKLYAAPPAPVADARIAELERECSQWRLELRIYRETENARIAELEQDVTELQRIKQAAELVLRWDWSDNDDDCLDDMRELSKAIDKAQAGNGGGS